jgi:anti-anti-sigma factor
MLTVEVKVSNNNAILHCQGRMVSGEEHALLCAALQQRGRNVTLDLSGVEAIDAAGIGALVSLQAAGVYLKLLNPKEHVSQILHLTKVDTIFEIGKSMEIEEAAPEGFRQLLDHDPGGRRSTAAI